MKASGWHRKALNTPAELARKAEYASPEHYAMRQAVKAQVDRGLAVCCRCRLPIARGSLWHLDHTEDRSGYLGPAHASCNLRAAAVKGARKRNGNGGTGPTRLSL